MVFQKHGILDSAVDQVAFLQLFQLNLQPMKAAKKKKKMPCHQPNVIKECHTSIKFLIHAEIRNDR